MQQEENEKDECRMNEEGQRREPAQSFQDLIVWHKAHKFVLGVYTLTQLFPKNEIYGLTSQFRRAAVSVPANIAEGFSEGLPRRESPISQHRRRFP